MESLWMYYLGVTVAFVFCVWFVWNEARRLVRHGVIRNEFRTSSMLQDVFVIVLASVLALALFIFGEMFFERIALGPNNVLYNLLPGMTMVPVLVTAISRIHRVFLKLKWAIEMDQLQTLSGTLMTSARPIAGIQSRMFSVYEDTCRTRDFIVRDESVSERLKTLLDQRVTVFYAKPSGECLPVARFVAPDDEVMSGRSVAGGEGRATF